MEKERRRKARTSLLSFTEYTFPEYRAAGHHKLIADALERVERGEIDRLMVTMPPRHGKSELNTKRFPAWALGRNPKLQVITASYNSDLSRDFGRSVRNIVNSQRYAALFDTRLAVDSKAADRWNTNEDGAYVAAGVGTAITGRGADLLLIDDPLKDREEAESELQRQKVFDWYTSTAYTRLMPGGAVILTQTRWHEDDLAGRLLEQMNEGGDQWHCLDLPAISDEGEALWPERYPLKALERIQTAIGPRDWSALYQQRPSPDEGTFFQRAWFNRHDAVPDGCHIYGCSDYAVTADGGDYTEHGVFAFAPDGTIYAIDWWFGQTAADEWIERKLDLMAKHKPLCWFGEGGVIQKAVEPMLKRRMREREVYCRTEWVASTKDKPTRARAIQSRAALGKLSLPKDGWAQRAIDQCLAFPAGKHDDAVDVLSLMGRVLDDAHPGVAPRPTEKPTARDKYDREREEDESWQTV